MIEILALVGAGLAFGHAQETVQGLVVAPSSGVWTCRGPNPAIEVVWTRSGSGDTWRCAVLGARLARKRVVTPGSIEVLLQGEMPLAQASVTIDAGERAQVTLARPTVEVTGQVFFGSVPAPAGTRIHFELERQRISTTTGEEGAFHVRLMTPGRYTARLESGRYFWTWTDSVDLVAGANRFDWRVPAGALRLTLKRHDGLTIDESVQLQCASKGFHAAGPVLPEELEQPVVIAGLPLDEVRCSADTKSGLVSNQLLVRLTSRSPVVDSTLDLRLLVGQVELRGALGGPLSGARVTVANMTLAEAPPGSGVYSLVRATPGAGMLITAPGHLPLCRIVKETDYPLFRLSMQEAGSAQVTFRLTPQATRPPGMVYGVPGSECPVMLFAFEPTLRSVGENSTEIRFFLPPGAYQYQPYSLFPLQPFSVPGSPLELTRPEPSSTRRPPPR